MNKRILNVQKQNITRRINVSTKQFIYNVITNITCMGGGGGICAIKLLCEVSSQFSPFTC